MVATSDTAAVGRTSTDAPPASVDAIVLAGGSGLRMGRSVNKVWLDIAGRPLIARPLMVLATEPRIRDVHLVVRAEDLSAARELLGDPALRRVRPPVTGGATRPASERAGLAALRPGSATVLIHDGARPALSATLLARLCDAAHHVGGAVPVVDFPQPVFGVDPTGCLVPPEAVVGGRASHTASLRCVQTPQIFARRPLLDAYRAASEAGFSGLDTADTVQRFTDLPIAAVPGEEGNLKVTYPADIDRIAAVLRRGVI